ncbi:proteoglycan 4-like [Toxorhynchites rutilus septentrionalis]|uniref:proteoglycan 4-like n=1 Tax=Toxorhynchites rutilus septentrionalis TaxID=329112 RepID=UPI00247AB4DC|nr:proteoglycan 4-like [Toxorhynchites rutilus septentrionalis]
MPQHHRKKKKGKAKKKKVRTTCAASAPTPPSSETTLSTPESSSSLSQAIEQPPAVDASESKSAFKPPQTPPIHGPPMPSFPKPPSRPPPSLSACIHQASEPGPSMPRFPKPPTRPTTSTTNPSGLDRKTLTLDELIKKFQKLVIPESGIFPDIHKSKRARRTIREQSKFGKHFPLKFGNSLTDKKPKTLDNQQPPPSQTPQEGMPRQSGISPTIHNNEWATNIIREQPKPGKLIPSTGTIPKSTHIPQRSRRVCPENAFSQSGTSANILNNKYVTSITRAQPKSGKQAAVTFENTTTERVPKTSHSPQPSEQVPQESLPSQSGVSSESRKNKRAKRAARKSKQAEDPATEKKPTPSYNPQPSGQANLPNQSGTLRGIAEGKHQSERQILPKFDNTSIERLPLPTLHSPPLDEASFEETMQEIEALVRDRFSEPVHQSDIETLNEKSQLMCDMKYISELIYQKIGYGVEYEFALPTMLANGDDRVDEHDDRLNDEEPKDDNEDDDEPFQAEDENPNDNDEAQSG